MTAHIFWPDAWRGAREMRAKKGKAPRLAVRRSIILREAPDGRWAAAIYEWKFGRYGKPTWLCAATTLAEAREAALSAWATHRLPMLWAYRHEKGVRPFYVGVSEPDGGRS